MSVKVFEKAHPWKDLPASAYYNPKDQMEVCLNVVVLNLADISTANLCYRMRLELWVAWPLTEAEVRRYIIQDPDKWVPDIHPDPIPWTISIEEINKMPFMSGRTTQVFMWRGKVMACECTLVTARYLESMELVNFPLDCQHLNFHIGLRCDCDIPLKIENDKIFYNSIESMGGFLNFDGRAMSRLYLDARACTFNVRTHLLSLEEFDLRAIECEIENTDRDIPFLHCSLRLSRTYLPYVFRIFVPMFIIMINSTLALRFPAGVDIRLTFVITNMLTIVAFLFIINEILPEIPYLTIVDKYMNFGFIYVGCIAILCVLLNYYDSEESEEEAQIFVFCVCGITAIHLGMVFLFRHLRSVEFRKLHVNRHEVDELEAVRLGNVKDTDEFLVHTDIHQVGTHQVFEGSLRKRISPLSAAGWLNEGGGKLLAAGEEVQDDVHHDGDRGSTLYAIGSGLQNVADRIESFEGHMEDHMDAAGRNLLKRF